MNKIQKVISVGDTIWSLTGKELPITKIDDEGFFCGDEYFFYDEHSRLYYLTKRGLMDAKDKKGEEGK